MLQNQLHEKDLEVKVLNQMIVSANKMVQVKTSEYNRLMYKVSSGRQSMPTILESTDEFSVGFPDCKLIDSKNSRIHSSATRLRMSSQKGVRDSALNRSSLGKKYSKLPLIPEKSQAKNETSDFLDQLDRSLLNSAYKPKTIEEIRVIAADQVK